MYSVRRVPMVLGLNMMQRKENASVRKIKTVILPVKMVGLSFTIRKQEHVNVIVNRLIHIFMGKDVKKHALRQVVMKIVLIRLKMENVYVTARPVFTGKIAFNSVKLVV